jgi:hypothetical protein
LPELPNLTASAAFVDEHSCSDSTIGCCNADEIVNRALKMARSKATVEDRSCEPEHKIIQLGENQSLKWRADSAEVLVIEIPSRLQDAAKPPCKVVGLQKLKTSWRGTNRDAVPSRGSAAPERRFPWLHELLYEL